MFVILSGAKNPRICFCLCFCLCLCCHPKAEDLLLLLPLLLTLSLDSATSQPYALPTKNAVISTEAKRSGEIRISTPAANPPSSKNSKNLPPHPHRHHRPNPKPPSSPPPGLHPMPRQHRRHSTRDPASLPPRHPPPNPHRRRPLRHHPRPLQTPPLTLTNGGCPQKKIIRVQMRPASRYIPNDCHSSPSSSLSGLDAMR